MTKENKMERVKPHEYIQYVMEQMDFSQIDLVKKGCGSPSHISEFVKGRRKPSRSFIVKFLAATNRKEMAYYFLTLL